MMKYGWIILIIVFMNLVTEAEASIGEDMDVQHMLRKGVEAELLIATTMLNRWWTHLEAEEVNEKSSMRIFF